MGSDRAKIAVSWPSKCFNPRSHTGSDTHVRKAHQGKLVSIHAPTWGATNKRGSSYVVSSFQSTLPHGERHKNKAAYVNAMMFQSTLPHGERHKWKSHASTATSFQSTLPHGERLPAFSVSLNPKRFQSTLPHGERLYLTARHKVLLCVSIHAPTRGATVRHPSSQD